MTCNFERALEYVLRNEGGYSDHPLDSGGPTKYGITIKTLSVWKSQQVTKTDILNLTKAEAGEIYKSQYWDKVKGDQLPLPIATAVFDAAVLFGVRVASIILQRIAQVKPDGIIGPITLGAAAKLEPSEFIPAFQVELRGRVNHIIDQYPYNQAFSNGWENRIDRLSNLVG